jgi:hypothetical protein
MHRGRAVSENGRVGFARVAPRLEALIGIRGGVREMATRKQTRAATPNVKKARRAATGRSKMGKWDLIKAIHKAR